MSPALHVANDWRRPEDPRDWQIWWSKTAQYGHILPRPSPVEVAEFYDFEDYYTHVPTDADKSRVEAELVGPVARVLGSIAWRFEHGTEPTKAWWQSIIPDGARTALEIGCGSGDRMLTFGPYVESVRGVEPDPRANSVARDRGLDVHEGTAEDLPNAVCDREYDLVVFTHVLEHTIDPVLSLMNARALLSDDGIMSIEVPNNACIGARRMGAAWRWLDAPRHLNFFTPKSLKACAEAAGLKVEAVLYRGYVRQFMPDWICDEARIRARLEGREMTQADVRRQVRHSAALLAESALARPEHKYDSVRILCRR